MSNIPPRRTGNPWESPQDRWRARWMATISSRLTWEQTQAWRSICARCGTTTYDALQAYALSVIRAGTISRALRHAHPGDTLLRDAIPLGAALPQGAAQDAAPSAP